MVETAAITAEPAETTERLSGPAEMSVAVTSLWPADVAASATEVLTVSWLLLLPWLAAWRSCGEMSCRLELAEPAVVTASSAAVLSVAAGLAEPAELSWRRAGEITWRVARLLPTAVGTKKPDGLLTSAVIADEPTVWLNIRLAETLNITCARLWPVAVGCSSSGLIS